MSRREKIGYALAAIFVVALILGVTGVGSYLAGQARERRCTELGVEPSICKTL